jgi:uncharacterized protein (TIGR04255 family)
MNEIPKPHELTKKPLVEAIFEVRWELRPGPGGDAVDPGFQVLLGRFYDRMSADFPELQSLPIAQIPEAMVPNMVRHRLRASRDGWPLIQLGPGVLSVNDTEGYAWKTFRPLLRRCVEALFGAYPVKIAPLSLVQATLRYVDAVALDALGNQENILSFLRNHLHTKISVEPLLFGDPSVAENPVGLHLRLNYPLTKPQGLGVISFGTGMKENVPSVTWENMVVSKDAHVPKTAEAFDEWLAEAHELTDRWFFALCRGRLLESFGGDNDA